MTCMPGRAPSRVSTISGFAQASRSRSAAGRSGLAIEAAMAPASAFTGRARAALQVRATKTEVRTTQIGEGRISAPKHGGEGVTVAGRQPRRHCDLLADKQNFIDIVCCGHPGRE